MELVDIKNMRFIETLLSKKGRVPSITGLLLPDIPATISYNPKEDMTHVNVDLEESELNRLESLKETKLLFPVPALPKPGPIVSRFIAKVAVGCMALRTFEDSVAHESFIYDDQLNPIKDHARRGTNINWPVSIRRIYEADSQWYDDLGSVVQRVHESDFLFTTESEVYFVMALFGVEYAINLGGTEIFGYQKWLKENSDRSPLYTQKDLAKLKVMTRPE